MQILLISPFFAPENQIASHRITAFAKYWSQAGNSVQVLTREPAFSGMPRPQSENIDVVRVRDPLARQVQAGISNLRTARGGWAKRNLLRFLQNIVKAMLFPDHYVFWAARAKKAIRTRIQAPDVIVASIGPVSCLSLGRYAYKHFGAPLVLDYRDLVTPLLDTPVKGSGSIRDRQTKRLEAKTMKVASLVSAVTTPMCESLKAAYSLPTTLVTNGFEARDFDGLVYNPDPSHLQIVYSGSIYPGLRDPSPLFKALAMVEDLDAKGKIIVDFYGKSSPEVLTAAQENGVTESIRFFGQIDHASALKAQVNADVLLLLYWNHPNERASYSGKLFEYIGAKRPILAMGIEGGVGPDLIVTNQLGVLLNEPSEIAEYLLDLVATKEARGSIPAPELSDMRAFTREYQSREFLKTLRKLVS